MKEHIFESDRQCVAWRYAAHADHRFSSKSDSELEISISDNGNGIPKGLHAIAVERFKQVKPTDGSGLRLVIAKAVAEQHGGRPSLKTLGPGLCVKISFGSFKGV